jgi:hypothetical protein
MSQTLNELFYITDLSLLIIICLLSSVSLATMHYANTKMPKQRHTVLLASEAVTEIM